MEPNGWSGMQHIAKFMLIYRAGWLRSHFRCKLARMFIYIRKHVLIAIRIILLPQTYRTDTLPFIFCIDYITQAKIKQLELRPLSELRWRTDTIFVQFILDIYMARFPEIGSIIQI